MKKVKKETLRSEGFALIATLWVMVLLTVIALSLSIEARQGSIGTKNFVEYSRAHYDAVSAVEEAVGYIMSDPDPLVDYRDGEGHFRTDAGRPPFKAEKGRYESEVEVRLSDEESRLNINYLNVPLLKKLLLHINVPEDDIEEIADSLADWVDPDDLHHLSGAEDEYYGVLGYRTKNRSLDVPEELLLVKGFVPEYLYGSANVKPLYPLVTTLSKGININTIPGELLEVLGFSSVEIENVLMQRENGGIKVSPAGFAGFGSVSSQDFRIEVSAPVKNSPQRVKVVSIINRPPDGTGYKTIYWKESIESGRT